MLHKFIQVFLDVRGPRRSEQAAIAESARTELRRAVKPPHDFPRDEQLNGFFQPLFVSHVKPVPRLAIVEDLLDVLARITRPPIEFFDGALTRFSLHMMPHVPRRAERGAFVARRGLDKYA